MTNPTKNQHQMPKDAMQCQRPVRMKNTGGVDKGGNSPHHIEIKKKVQRILCLFSLCIMINRGHRYMGRLQS